GAAGRGRGVVPAPGRGGAAGPPDPVADAVRPLERPTQPRPRGPRVAQARLGGRSEVPRVPPRLPARRNGLPPPARPAATPPPRDARLAQRKAVGLAPHLRRGAGADDRVDRPLLAGDALSLASVFNCHAPLLRLLRHSLLACRRPRRLAPPRRQPAR